MPRIDVLRDRAAANLEAFAGTPKIEAPGLAAANEQAAAEEALEALAGGPAPFNSIADQRAARLARVTRKFNELNRGRDPEVAARMLSAPEVQLIFRVPKTTANTAGQRMRAMFPELEDELLLIDIAAGHEKVSRAGSGKAGRSLKVKFKTDNGLASATALLERRGLLGKCDIDRPMQTVTLPYDQHTKEDVEVVVSDVLGLPLPK